MTTSSCNLERYVPGKASIEASTVANVFSSCAGYPVILTSMWLLNTKTGILHHFVDHTAVGEYGILSHVWGDDEQTFQQVHELSSSATNDWEKADSSLLAGLSPKIKEVCRFTASLGLSWVWVDTCCIDKTSSSELSEAINSMFQWYSESQVCVTYLADVPDSRDHEIREQAIRNSKWFTRGWTLQELIAPCAVLFVSSLWTWIGTKSTLAPLITEITGIDIEVLTFQRKLAEISVARRLSWASKRHTTRVEDQAYSLQGLFGVNMPTIYGEGQAAFRRLQEEIIKLYPDHTIYAWNNKSSISLLASSPSDFSDSATMDTLDFAQIPRAVDQFVMTIPEVRIPHYFPFQLSHRLSL